MKLWLLTAAAAAGLAGVVAVTAFSSANGAPRGTLLLESAARSSPVRPVALRACSAGGGAGASSVRLGGACGGVLTGRFTCVNEGEVQALSIRRPLGNGRDFYLTVVIPEYEGAGDYFADAASAQVAGPAVAPRWANAGYGLPIHATRDGTFELGETVLLPVPGTPASGVITVRGRAACG